MNEMSAMSTVCEVSSAIHAQVKSALVHILSDVGENVSQVSVWWLAGTWPLELEATLLSLTQTASLSCEYDIKHRVHCIFRFVLLQR